jgi:ComF family protein
MRPPTDDPAAPAEYRRPAWGCRWSFMLQPPRCYFCAASGDLGCIDLCARCHGGLPWLATPVRGVDPAAGRSAHDGPVLAALNYAAPVDTALKALKFGADRAAARVLGVLLAGVAGAAIAAGRLTPPQFLLPVPLHPSRLAERGFNQAHLLASHAGRWLRLPVRDDWLQRLRPTLPQTSLHAGERRHNVASAFAVTPPLQAALRLRPLRCVALLDDVMTTGATLEAARAALLGAGVAEVQRWSVATPMPTHSARPT